MDTAPPASPPALAAQASKIQASTPPPYSSRNAPQPLPLLLVPFLLMLFPMPPLSFAAGFPPRSVPGPLPRNNSSCSTESKWTDVLRASTRRSSFVRSLEGFQSCCRGVRRVDVASVVSEFPVAEAKQEMWARQTVECRPLGSRSRLSCAIDHHFRVGVNNRESSR